jgi:hypothetical protein
MKKQFLKASIGIMALVFVAGLAMIPSKTVSADVDTTIKPGQTQGIDLRYDCVWWFKYTPSKDILVEISSAGSTAVKVDLYKGNKDEGSLVAQALNGTGSDSQNFSLTKLLKAGTYYYKVTTFSDSSSISNNNTRITLTDVADEEKVVKIDKTNFPDDVFRAFVDKHFDIKDDDYLTRDEIKLVKEIEVDNLSIANLKGIEYFSELKSLSAEDTDLTTLSLTKNSGLTNLNCSNNQKLKSMVLTGCPDLLNLSAYDNPLLTSLNLKNCTLLESIYCSDCSSLSVLDLSSCSSLSTLYCDDTNISTLNLSGLKYLFELCCNGTPLSTLNVKGCRELHNLYCNKTALVTLDLSSCINLYTLECSNCSKLTTLKLSKFVNVLDCSNCSLSSLSLTDCVYLYRCYCYKSGITKLDISSCPYLNGIFDETLRNVTGDRVSYSGTVSGRSCYLTVDSGIAVTGMSNPNDIVVEINEKNFPDINFRNNISGYDLNGDGRLSKMEISRVTRISLNERNIDKLDGIQYFTSLRNLECSRNNLTALDLSKNTKLEYLHCDNNKITKLTLGTHKNLLVVDIVKNRISTVDLSGLTGLVSLRCSDNNLSALDLSKNTKLIRLYCDKNNLSKLDLSKCVDLEEIYCFGNKLTALDLSQNTNLISLSCSKNNLKNLDLSKNTKIVSVECILNQITKINIGNNKQLCNLRCSDNSLNTLDITNCPHLIRAYKSGPFDQAANNVYYYTYTYLVGGVYYIYSYRNNQDTLIIDKTVKIITSATLSLDKKTASVACGKNLTLKATTNSTNTISWKSSDTKIATVDSTGKITGKQAGKVTITATVSGKSAKCTVTVLYKDVINSKDFWYAPTNYLTAKGVVKGYANQTEFRPANVCSRAQMVTFLYRLQGEPKTKATTCNFTDVKSKDYFYKPVIWAVENGITTGVSAKKFNPQGACTRAQTVTFLWRMAGKPEPGKGAKTFSDVKKTDYFYKATLWASGKKILAGYDDGTFRPQGKCLRRQMVTFLYKYDKYVNGKG